VAQRRHVMNCERKQPARFLESVRPVTLERLGTIHKQKRLRHEFHSFRTRRQRQEQRRRRHLFCSCGPQKSKLKAHRAEIRDRSSQDPDKEHICYIYKHYICGNDQVAVLPSFFLLYDRRKPLQKSNVTPRETFYF
jgi:hypothetical protein